METNEFRVRAVTRYVVTHYHYNEEAREAGCGPMGEFDHLEYAMQIGAALAASIPGAKFLGGPSGNDDGNDI